MGNFEKRQVVHDWGSYRAGFLAGYSIQRSKKHAAEGLAWCEFVKQKLPKRESIEEMFKRFVEERVKVTHE